MIRLCLFILCVFSYTAHSKDAQLVAFESSECLVKEDSQKIRTSINLIDDKVVASFLLTFKNGKVFDDSNIKQKSGVLAIYMDSFRPEGIRIKEYCHMKIDIEIELEDKGYERLDVYLDNKLSHQIKIPNHSYENDAKNARLN